MIKRYQVFISSTYADLMEERAKVIQTIMELDCIPAGMEIFPAIDEEQFNFIKRIIDDCDYYLLIIGGRYGSVSEDGISYTEKEYDYAIIKGIKVIAFIHSNPDEIPLGKSEKDSNLAKKLDDFKTKVSTNRLIKYWRTAEELPGLVSLSLSKTIKTYPAVGWIRANTISNPEVLQELNEQRKINEDLKAKIDKQIEDVPDSQTIELSGLADLDDEFKVEGTHSNSTAGKSWSLNLKWKDIFYMISPYLLEHPADSVIKSTLALDFHKLINDRTAFSPNLDNQNYQTIKLHLQAMGLIKVEFLKTTQGGSALFWQLTPKGTQLMMQLRAVKK